MKQEYPVTIKRSRRKTASIYVERDGSLTVLVPDSTTDEQVQHILASNEYRVYKYQSKRQLLNDKAVKREMVSGQSLLFLGRNYYLEYRSTAKDVSIDGNHFIVPEKPVAKLKELLKEFYRKEGQQFIPPKVNRFAAMMGITLEEVTILELMTRWASCSVKKPKLNFHWKVMMAPVSVIDYLIVHELCHMKHPRHNAAFWNEVDKYYHDYQAQVAWLKSYGAMLDV